MTIQTISGVKIAELKYVLGERELFTADRLMELGSEKADDIVKATGFTHRRIAGDNDSSFTLQLAAAKKLETKLEQIGAIVAVSFTQDKRMPANSARLQAALRLPKDIICLDLLAACSGYGYALYTAALLVKATGKKVLIADGDKQSDFLDPMDVGAEAVLSDGASATIIAPSEDESKLWSFHFETDGEKGAALELEKTIKMDGFGVYRYVAMQVSSIIRRFMAEMGHEAASYDKFVPHQANLYMAGQLAKSLGFEKDRVALNSERIGNLASASVPVAWAMSEKFLQERRVLVSGFGGGLSMFVSEINL